MPRAKKKEEVNNKSTTARDIYDKTINGIKEHWKLIVWCLGPVVILAIIFALPLKTVPVQVTETYWDTEMKSEPYTVSEAYTDVETATTTQMQTRTVYDSYVDGSGWSYTVNVDKPNSKVTIQYYGFPYYGYPECDVVCNPSDPSSCQMHCWPFAYGGSGGRALVKITYPEEVPTQQTVTKYRDVTKYREVPTQVLKERSVSKNVRMSTWGYIFR
jgi:hypothetical protein